ncbi:MAG: hypothetical protein QMD03_01405 [Syntrophales bacterium]|nr:hypothetical protein [Syntrophales bacterium]
MSYNTWWVTRPRRYLNPVPEAIKIFANYVGEEWLTGSAVQLDFEDELVKAGLKGTGGKRDKRGSGARTWAAWLKMWGLWFREHQTRTIQLTICGEALVRGQDPVPLLTKQVLTFQYPAPYFQEGRATINPDFRIHPYRLILELLLNEKVNILTEEELSRIVIFTKTKKEMFSKVKEILRFRKNPILREVTVLYYKYSKEMYGLDRRVKRIIGIDKRIERDIIDAIARDIGYSRDVIQTVIEKEAKFEKDFGTAEERESIANTMVNHLEYTQSIERERGTESCFYIKDKDKEAVKELFERYPERFIPIHERTNPLESEELYLRQYGLDLFRRKDTRKLTQVPVVPRGELAKRKIIRVYQDIQARKPTTDLSTELFSEISKRAGCPFKQVEEIISKEVFPPSLEAFERRFLELSVSGLKGWNKFQEVSTNLFGEDGFGFIAKNISHEGREPDILIIAIIDDEYVAIIDVKAQPKFSLPVRPKMCEYIEKYKKYNHQGKILDLAFYLYLAGGFKGRMNIVRKISNLTGIQGAYITSENIVRLLKRHKQSPVSQGKFREIFSIDREVTVSDIERI